jgi:hypothetical protein
VANPGRAALLNHDVDDVPGARFGVDKSGKSLIYPGILGIHHMITLDLHFGMVQAAALTIRNR